MNMYVFFLAFPVFICGLFGFFLMIQRGLRVLIALYFVIEKMEEKKIILVE